MLRDIYAKLPQKDTYPTPESEGIDVDKTFPEPTPEELNDIFPPDED